MHRCVPSFLAVVCLSAAAPGSAQPPGPRLADQVLQAYAETAQYEATLDYSIVQTQGRWQMSQRAQFRLALDRPTGRLLVDSPGPLMDFLLVVDGRKIWARSKQFPGHHVEAAGPAPLSYQTLRQHTEVNQIQLLDDPLLIDLVMLLADEPMAMLSGGAAKTAVLLPPEPADEVKDPKLELRTPIGTMTLTIDPLTKLIKSAVHEVGPQFRLPGNSMKYVYHYHTKTHNQPLREELFEFDNANSRAVATLGDVVAAASVTMGWQPEASMTGQAAPVIRLKTVDGDEFHLEDIDAKIIVLDFWTTWCPPCLEGLPKIERLHDWAEREGISLVVRAVNVGETVEQVKQFWRHQGLTVPVLLDEDGSVSIALGIDAIPQTVVIADGVVQYVHVGVENLEQSLRDRIDALLQADESGDADGIGN